MGLTKLKELTNGVQFQYSFHPVGQGIFSTGFVRTPWHQKIFRWFYDCGSKDEKLICHALNELEVHHGSVEFDVGFLSHFDADHVNGITRLLKKFSVRQLVLPYLAPWRRLEVAISSGLTIDDALFNFYLDPVGYLQRVADNTELELVLVHRGSERESDRQDESGVLPLPNLDTESSKSDREWDASWPENGDPDSDIESDIWRGSERRRSTVRWLPLPARMQLDGLWEFVVYSDERRASKATQSFRRKTSILTRRLIREADDGKRRELFGRIKDNYDAHFGRGSVNRNGISLFVYAGPLIDYSKISVLVTPSPFDWWKAGPRFGPGRKWGDEQSKPAILYTGDGDFRNRPKVPARSQVLKYFGSERIDRLGVFQVPHHGARSSWSPGAAADVSPLISVFCSDPRKYQKHPDACVLSDFWLYGATQVDDKTGLEIDGLINTAFIKLSKL